MKNIPNTIQQTDRQTARLKEEIIHAEYMFSLHNSNCKAQTN
jgi:hypothetical protein